MGWTGFIAVLFMLLLIDDVSSLSSVLNFRKLSASQPANDPAPAQVPPLPNPVPGAEKLAPETSGSDKSSASNSNLTENAASSDTVSPNVTALSPPASDQTSNKNDSENKDNEKKLSPPQGEDIDKRPNPPQGDEIDKKSSPPEGKEVDKKVSPPQAKEADEKSSPTSGVFEICDGKEKMCQIQNMFTGCIRNFKSDAKVLEILVQNAGQETLIVNLTVPTSPTDDQKDVVVSKGQIIELNISNIIGRASKILLSSGKSECQIDIGSALSEGNALFHLPTTEQLLTPVNGAYFVILTMVTFGGVLACCKFTKRRRHGPIPYQELEMASPETVSTVNAETAEGWDQGWDDDWDEENPVKSPVARLHMGNISANGLTSRPANRDGWEDWDD